MLVLVYISVLVLCNLYFGYYQSNSIQSKLSQARSNLVKTYVSTSSLHLENILADVEHAAIPQTYGVGSPYHNVICLSHQALIEERLAAHGVGEFFHVMSSNLSTGNSFSSDWIGLDWIWNSIRLLIHFSTATLQKNKGRIDPTMCTNLGRIDPTD